MQRSVLIIDAISTRRIHMRAQLDTAAYPVDLADTQTEGLALIRKDPPDVVFIADDLPGLRLRQFCKTLRGNTQTQFTTVVVAVRSENQSARVSALVDGAHDVIDMNSDGVDLKARVRSFMRTSGQSEGWYRQPQTHAVTGLAEAVPEFAPKTVASFVARDSEIWFAKILSDVSAASGIDIRPTSAQLARRNPDVESDVYILLETGSDDGARDTLVALRSHPTSRDSRILFVTDCPSQIASPLDLGADDQVPTTITATELRLRIDRLARRKRDADRKRKETTELAQKAYVDALTGLSNRTAMEEYLLRMDHALAAQPRAVAMMIADVDHFKAINDNHGHAAGDVILAQLARTMRSKLRDGDFIARYGGEEFLIVLPNVEAEQAHDVALRLRDAVADNPIALNASTHVRATISIGLAVARRNDRMSTTDLQRAADNALYSAKRNGRNRIDIALLASSHERPLGGTHGDQ